MYKKSVETNLFLHLYEISKRDLYTLLIKNSENKLDYVGKITRFGSIVEFDYRRVNRTGLDYTELLLACQNIITPLLKNDLMLWGKTDAVEKFYTFSPNSNNLCEFNLSLTLKEEASESK